MVFTFEQIMMILALAGLVFGFGSLLIALADEIKKRIKNG